MQNVNFTQYIEEGHMDSFTYGQAQRAVDTNNIDLLRSVVSEAETLPRDVICAEYRSVHGTTKAEADLDVEFIN